MKRQYGLRTPQMPKRTKQGNLYWWVTKDGARDGRWVERNWIFQGRGSHKYELKKDHIVVARFKTLKACRDWLNQSELERIVAAI